MSADACVMLMSRDQWRGRAGRSGSACRLSLPTLAPRRAASSCPLLHQVHNNTRAVLVGELTRPERQYNNY
jgi:hypothetical protein